MKDELITFETAKLAKEKGFNEPTIYGYDKYDQLWNNQVVVGDLSRNSDEEDFIVAPSQSLLQRWLREEHNIHCYSKVFRDSLKNKTTYVCDFIQLNTGGTIKTGRLSTYEEALEDGLQEALKLIKTEK